MNTGSQLNMPLKQDKPRVLVACEMSGRVRDAFRGQGCYAESCDLKPTASPGPHYEGDLFDGTLDLTSYDLIIAHPPCTYICNAGGWRWRNTPEREAAVKFFKRIWDIPIPRMAIENSVGIMNRLYPSPKVLPRPYYIQPFQHGHTTTKRTGLWTRGLPKIVPSRIVPIARRAEINNVSETGEKRREIRSLTYYGIAKALAQQWTPILKQELGK